MAKTRATEDALGQLHDAVCREITERINSGEATASELMAAMKFLKDNGINCDLESMQKGTPQADLLENLPYTDPDHESWRPKAVG